MTIRQVAETAGVSVATASLALRDNPRIAAETRKLVARTAKRLNYRKRPPGRPAKGADEPRTTNRVNRIALVAPGMPRGVLNSPVYLDVLHGVEAALAERGKMFVLRHLLPEAPPPPSLFPQKVDGAVLFGEARDKEIRTQLSELPCVQMMGLVPRRRAWDHVTYDNDAIGELAAKYLLEAGHRRLAMVAPDTSTGEQPISDITAGRRGSFRSHVEAAGATLRLVYDEPLVQLTPTHQEPVRETLERVIDQLLAAKPRPTGLFCPFDLLTAGLYPLLLARGINPGRDLEVVSCNNEALLLQNLHPRPATVDIHASEVGRRAVGQLLWRLDRPKALRATITLAPELVPPES